MHLAFIHARKPGSLDATFEAVVAALGAAQWHLAGVVQPTAVDPSCHRCDRDLVSLASGARIAISQPLGSGSTGCRLDPGALETAAQLVDRDLDRQRPDLLIVNRFGKLECAGRGFTPVIVRALELDVPVLIGVNDTNRLPFHAFAGELARELPDDARAVTDHLLALRQRAAA